MEQPVETVAGVCAVGVFDDVMFAPARRELWPLAHLVVAAPSYPPGRSVPRVAVRAGC